MESGESGTQINVTVCYQRFGDYCSFRITPEYTFEQLNRDACKYWEVPVDAWYPDIDFVPLVYSRGSLDNVEYLKAEAQQGRIRYLLGFNEPDLASQMDDTAITLEGAPVRPQRGPDGRLLPDTLDVTTLYKSKEGSLAERATLLSGVRRAISRKTSDACGAEHERVVRLGECKYGLHARMAGEQRLGKSIVCDFEVLKAARLDTPSAVCEERYALCGRRHLSSLLGEACGPRRSSIHAGPGTRGG